MTDARIGYGSLFEVSTDGGTVWVALAEVMEISPPSDDIDIVDATHMQSPNATREFIIGLTDPGECSLEMNFIPGGNGDAKIQAIRAARVPVKCRITFSNAAKWTFDAILTGYEPAAPNEDKMTATVTFKVTGPYVPVPAAAPVNSVLPAISGIAQVGQTLTAYPGAWSGAPSFAYQWKDDGVNIAGATAATFVVTTTQLAGAITVTVTATNSIGTASATSAATPAVIAA